MIKLSSSFQNGPIKKLIEISKHEKEPIRRQLLKSILKNSSQSITKFLAICHQRVNSLTNRGGSVSNLQ